VILLLIAQSAATLSLACRIACCLTSKPPANSTHLAGVDSPIGGVALLTPELVETSTRGEQLVDRAVLDDAAGVEEKNPGGVPDAGQPMGDDHPGPRLRVRGERVDDRSLVLGVQRTSRLVDQQYRRRLEQSARNADPLPFTTGQRRTGFADDRLGAGGQPAGEFIHSRQRDCPAELRVG